MFAGGVGVGVGVGVSVSVSGVGFTVWLAALCLYIPLVCTARM